MYIFSMAAILRSFSPMDILSIADYTNLYITDIFIFIKICNVCACVNRNKTIVVVVAVAVVVRN